MKHPDYIWHTDLQDHADDVPESMTLHGRYGVSSDGRIYEQHMDVFGNPHWVETGHTDALSRRVVGRELARLALEGRKEGA